jgi:hypothetical protein
VGEYVAYMNLISLLPSVSPDRDAKSEVMTRIDRVDADFRVFQAESPSERTAKSNASKDYMYFKI